MINFTKRNLKVFFRDKTGVFFSLLGVLIVVALFAFFLGDTYSDSMNTEGIKDPDNLINGWLVAGVLAITSVTTAMGAFGTMVDDKAKNIAKDFYSSPVKRKSLVAGYILSSFIIAMIMTMIVFVLSEVYIKAKGGEILEPIPMLKALGVMLLTVLANTSFVLFIISFIKTGSAYSTVSTIIGTMIGFVTGIYVPIGSFAESIQVFIKFFPTSHGAVLLRQIFMEKPLAHSFKGVPKDVLTDFKETLGVSFKLGDHYMSATTSIAILVGAIVVFSALSVLSLSRKKK